MGLQQGVVGIPGLDWRSLFPVFHEEALAQELKLG